MSGRREHLLAPGDVARRPGNGQGPSDNRRRRPRPGGNLPRVLYQQYGPVLRPLAQQHRADGGDLGHPRPHLRPGIHLGGIVVSGQALAQAEAATGRHTDSVRLGAGRHRCLGRFFHRGIDRMVFRRCGVPADLSGHYRLCAGTPLGALPARGGLVVVGLGGQTQLGQQADVEDLLAVLLDRADLFHRQTNAGQSGGHFEIVVTETEVAELLHGGDQLGFGLQHALAGQVFVTLAGVEQAHPEGLVPALGDGQSLAGLADGFTVIAAIEGIDGLVQIHVHSQALLADREEPAS